MGLEIERKYLVKNDSWKQNIQNTFVIKQGYLNLDPERTVRIRIKNDKSYLTVKGKTKNATRKEFEYQIPVFEGEEMLALCEKSLVEKTRFEILHEDRIWEIDVFENENKGLIVAEIELSSESEQFNFPDFIGNEVTQESKYYNSNLISTPFSKW